MGIYPMLSKFYHFCKDDKIKEEKNPGKCYIIEDKENKQKTEWYFRIRDGTLHTNFTPNELVGLAVMV